MVETQEGKCCICQKVPNELHIDHNHDTGKIRGLLCFNCNTSLGKFEDSEELLMQAILYLRERNV